MLRDTTVAAELSQSGFCGSPKKAYEQESAPQNPPPGLFGFNGGSAEPHMILARKPLVAVELAGGGADGVRGPGGQHPSERYSAERRRRGPWGGGVAMRGVGGKFAI